MIKRLALACYIPLLLLFGCGKAGPNLRPVAIASETFSVALKGLQAQFIVWADAGVVPKETEVRWQAAFKQMAQTGLAVDAAVRAGDHASVSANASAALTLVESLIRDEVVKLSPSQRGAVSVALQSIRGFILIWQTFQAPAQVGSRADLLSIAEAN